MKRSPVSIRKQLCDSVLADMDKIFVVNNEVWKENPVTFREFVTSDEHMAFPPLSEKQEAPFDFMFGKDPKKIFDNGNTTSILCWGKGCCSGETELEDALTHKRYTIEELYKNQKNIFVNSYDEESQEVKIAKASIPWITGKGAIYEVKTVTNKIINVYKYHKFLTPKGWKRLSDLKVNDKILNDALLFERIQSITYLRDDNYYDLEVDKYHNYLAHGLFNHNSGKDTITALLMCYVIYVLLCLRSPQKFLNLPEGEAIDLLNVAVNAQQASGVFFEKFKQRLIRWQWLRDKYPVKFSGSFLGQARIEDILNTVTITQNAAVFPNNIRAISGHSGANSQEGKNILFFVCDEIAGFDDSPTTNKGISIFNMMKSSAISRFGNRYKGVALSFTRYEGDAILRLYDQGQGELHWFCDKACTWEVKPAHCFKDYPQKYFEYQGQKIPLEFQSEFKADPENAKTKYMCLPSAISGVFIEKPERVRACIDSNRLPIVTTQDIVQGNYVKKLITGYNVSRTDLDYIVTIDLGLRSDSAALSIFHTESSGDGLKAIQDLMIGWVPDPENHIEVSMNDVKEFLVDVSKHIHIKQVYFDQWNSALLIEQLNELNIPSEEYRLGFADYKHAKEVLYAGRVSLQPNERLQEEFRRLIITRAKRVDHPSGFHNDFCDTVVGAIKILLTKRLMNTNNIMMPGMYIQNNLQSIGGTFVGIERN